MNVIIIETLQKQVSELKNQLSELKKELIFDEKTASDDIITHNAKLHSMEKSDYIAVFGDDELKTRYNIINKSDDEPNIQIGFGTITKARNY